MMHILSMIDNGIIDLLFEKALLKWLQSCSTEEGQENILLARTNMDDTLELWLDKMVLGEAHGFIVFSIRRSNRRLFLQVYEVPKESWDNFRDACKEDELAELKKLFEREN